MHFDKKKVRINKTYWKEEKNFTTTYKWFKIRRKDEKTTSACKIAWAWHDQCMVKIDKSPEQWILKKKMCWYDKKLRIIYHCPKEGQRQLIKASNRGKFGKKMTENLRRPQHIVHEERVLEG